MPERITTVRRITVVQQDMDSALFAVPNPARRKTLVTRGMMCGTVWLPLFLASPRLQQG